MVSSSLFLALLSFKLAVASDRNQPVAGSILGALEQAVEGVASVVAPKASRHHKHGNNTARGVRRAAALTAKHQYEAAHAGIEASMLMIAILSDKADVQGRMLVRETWGRFANRSQWKSIMPEYHRREREVAELVSVRFFVSRMTDRVGDEEKLQEESKLGDIIHLKTSKVQGKSDAVVTSAVLQVILSFVMACLCLECTPLPGRWC